MGPGWPAMKRTTIGPSRVASLIPTGMGSWMTLVVFKFVGNVTDLSDGTFDLGTWFKRVKKVTGESSVV